MVLKSLIPPGRKKVVRKAVSDGDKKPFGKSPAEEPAITKAQPKEEQASAKKVLPTPGNLQRLKDELIVAIERKDLERVKELINAGCPIEFVHEENGGYTNSPLTLAITKDSEEIVGFLIREETDLDFENKTRDFKRDGKALKIAIERGNPEIVESILKELKRRGIDVNQHLGNALLIAVLEHRPKIQVVRKLIEYGADVNQINKNGWNCLHIVLSEFSLSNAIPFVELLVGAKIDPNSLITKEDYRGCSALDLVRIKGKQAKSRIESDHSIRDKEGSIARIDETVEKITQTLKDAGAR